MNKNILIFGANGQLGTDLVRVFTEQNLSFDAVTRHDFDVLTDNLDDKFANATPLYIINCIATTNVDGCETDPDLAFRINASFAYCLAKFCHAKNIRLIHLSTDYIFDGTKTEEYTESDEPNPLNIYGLSKYAGELAIQNYHDKYFIFRVSSLFGKAGASGKGGNFITTMQNLAAKLDTVSVIADQITCPTSTLSIAKCITHFIVNDIQDYGIYNCVSSNSCSWFDFAKRIFQLSGLNEKKLLPLSFANYNFKAKRPKSGVLAVNKLNKYYTMPTWQESLQIYFNQ